MSTHERKSQYKKGVSVEDGRHRRQDTTVQIRKSKRQEQMKQTNQPIGNPQNNSTPKKVSNNDKQCVQSTSKQNSTDGMSAKFN